MHDQVSIRPAARADLDAIAAIAEATELFPGAMLPDMISGYLNGSKPDLWLAAVSSAAVIGFAFCEPERLTNGTWNLLAIGVSPDRQSHGVGARIVKHLEDELRRASHRMLLVETLGTPEFARARAFYGANGFIEEARIRDFYDLGGDKIVFLKQL